jgi:hypothetical protein
MLKLKRLPARGRRICTGVPRLHGVLGSASLEALRNAKVGTLTIANMRGPKT